MPQYAVIIPAFNEEAYLPGTIAALKEAMAAVDAGGEIIVTDNNSTDRTAEIAEQCGARVVFESKNQIALARNTGARAASHETEFLIFLDADTHLHPETLRQTLEALDSDQVCGGGAIVKTDFKMPRLISWFLAGWNRMAPKMGWAAGCFLFCPKEAWEATGGFDERVYAGEEVWFSNQLRKWGRKNGKRKFRVLSEPPVVTSGRKAKWFTPWQFVRQLGFLMLFPWATRSKRFCAMWYRRPETVETNG